MLKIACLLQCWLIFGIFSCRATCELPSFILRGQKIKVGIDFITPKNIKQWQTFALDTKAATGLGSKLRLVTASMRDRESGQSVEMRDIYDTMKKNDWNGDYVFEKIEREARHFNLTPNESWVVYAIVDTDDGVKVNFERKEGQLSIPDYEDTYRGVIMAMDSKGQMSQNYVMNPMYLIRNFKMDDVLLFISDLEMVLDKALRDLPRLYNEQKEQKEKEHRRLSGRWSYISKSDKDLRGKVERKGSPPPPKSAKTYEEQKKQEKKEEKEKKEPKEKKGKRENEGRKEKGFGSFILKPFRG